ncbi:MAG TPA: STAS domain-containing protein [Candidatus Sulfotelmatobacter sp.]|jgi:stage II sporulation protein AA (anti-sigma F factor antagonist)|nr:STAS domain-containing protein [Candidatus Sulfotelmatobacter sp.]
MEYEIRDLGQRSEIFLKGRLTFEGNETFRQIYDTVEAVPARPVTLDVSAVDFIDSAGLGMVMLLRDCTAAKGGSLALRNPKGQVRRLLDICHMDSLLPIIQ